MGEQFAAADGRPCPKVNSRNRGQEGESVVHRVFTLGVHLLFN
jgi:hypothetical protein